MHRDPTNGRYPPGVSRSSPKALEWSRKRIASTHPLSDQALALFSVCPKSLVNEEMDTASQIANELIALITDDTIVTP